jgi:hypothetical protein
VPCRAVRPRTNGASRGTSNANQDQITTLVALGELLAGHGSAIQRLVNVAGADLAPCSESRSGRDSIRRLRPKGLGLLGGKTPRFGLRSTSRFDSMLAFRSAEQLAFAHAAPNLLLYISDLPDK